MSQASVEHITVDEHGVARLISQPLEIMHIAVHARRGMSVEDIHAGYPQLTLAEIHAALAYYYDHQPQIEKRIEDTRAFAEVMRSQTENSELANKLRSWASHR
jgi:hypothetical protein